MNNCKFVKETKYGDYCCAEYKGCDRTALTFKICEEEKERAKDLKRLQPLSDEFQGTGLGEILMTPGGREAILTNFDYDKYTVMYKDGTFEVFEKDQLQTTQRKSFEFWKVIDAIHDEVTLEDMAALLCYFLHTKEMSSREWLTLKATHEWIERQIEVSGESESENSI